MPVSSSLQQVTSTWHPAGQPSHPLLRQRVACCIDMQETPDSERPYPMVVMGDVLTDLPGVSNFEEVSDFSCNLDCISMQAVMRLEHSCCLDLAWEGLR